MKELRFPEVERILARMHRIEPDEIIAFRSRLHHFRNLGVPEGIKTGQGRRPTYGWAEMLQMVIALELAELDITPKTISRFIRISRIKNEKRYVTVNTNKNEKYFIIASPSWMEESFGGVQGSSIKFVKFSELQSSIEPFLDADDSGFILINLTKTLRRLATAMEEEDRENGKHKKPKTKR